MLVLLEGLVRVFTKSYSKPRGIVYALVNQLMAENVDELSDGLGVKNGKLGLNEVLLDDLVPRRFGRAIVGTLCNSMSLDAA